MKLWSHFVARCRRGNIDQATDHWREQRSRAWFEELVSVVQATLRLSRRSPAFSATIVVTLALVLGANVVVFSLVRGVLLKPLGFPASDRVVVTLNQYPRENFGRVGASVPNYFERKAGIPAFAEVAAVRFSSATVGNVPAAENVAAGYVTPSFFRLLDVRPALGRSFLGEGSDSSPIPEVVISEEYWRRRFSADAAVLGREVRLNGEIATVVGVLPRDFRYPSHQPQIWLPLTFKPDEEAVTRRHSTSVDVIARLKPEASIGDAQRQLDSLNARLARDDPMQAWAADAGFRATVVSLHDDSVAAVKPAVLLLQTGAGFLFLIAIANVINLLLVRAVARSKEFAVRRAMGASRARVAAQIVIETLVLTLSGGLIGVAGAWVVLRETLWLREFHFPLADSLTLDWPVVLVALGGTLITGLVSALPVIACVLGENRLAVFAHESHGGTSSRSIRQIRHGLMVVQVALAFLLLAITALLGVSLRHVLAINPGFQPDNLLTGVFSLPSARYATPEQRLALSERLLAELRTHAEVKAAGISTAVPFGNVGGIAVTVNGNPAPTAGAPTSHYLSLVGGAFFDVLRPPLREGRYLTADDSHRTKRVCVIDETFARIYWPGRSPLGYRVFDGVSRDPSDAGATIVGVVGTVQEGDPSVRPLKGKIYYALAADWTPSFLYLVAKSEGDPSVLAPAMRAALAAMDPELALFEVRSLRARLDESSSPRSAPLRVAGPFAGIALVLCVVGVYAVVAYDVSQRRREIGIRMALGATPGMILGIFLSLGSRIWVTGMVAGVGVTLGGGHLLQSLLYGVAADSGSILFPIAALVGLAVVFASILPSLHAARIPPAEALRCE